jgi:threonine/homoserine/homoserine lactone efflux protein
MLPLETLLLFIPVGLIVAAIPGPDMLLLSATVLQSGMRAAYKALLGIAAGILIHAVAAGLGVAHVLKNIPIAFEVLRYAGAAYLFYLAYTAYQSTKQQKPDEPVEHVVVKNQKFFVRGLVTNLLNPKAFIVSTLIYMQFVTNQQPLFWQFISLGMCMTIIALLFYGFMIALLASTKRLLQHKKHSLPLPVKRMAEKAVAGLFGFFALRLLFMERPQ